DGGFDAEDCWGLEFLFCSNQAERVGYQVSLSLSGRKGRWYLNNPDILINTGRLVSMLLESKQGRTVLTRRNSLCPAGVRSSTDSVCVIDNPATTVSGNHYKGGAITQRKTISVY